MRSMLAGALGLSLGLSAVAHAQQPAAGLGRPVPAASLGRPTPLYGDGGQQPFQPAAYRGKRPVTVIPTDTAPILAPIGDEQLPAPKPMPMPADGGPGSTAVPPPGYGAGAPTNPYYGPMAGPAYGPVAAPGGCASCAGAPGGEVFMGDPGMMAGPWSAPGFFAGNPGGPNRFYASFDFLMWWTPTINTPVALAMAAPGPFVVGAPFPAGAFVAIGNTDLISEIRLGGRFNAGVWLDPCHALGLDGTFFFAGPSSRDITAVPPPGGSLWRPYTVINLPAPGAPAPPPGVPNFADIVTGFINVHTDSFLMGGDINARRQILGGCGNFLDALIGFRYQHLDEALQISESSAAVGAAGALNLTDRFATSNDFFGIQIGAVAHKQWGQWSADLTMKLGIGTTQSAVEASGTNNFGGGVPANIGLFVNDTNRGRYTSGTFSLIPEVGLNLGYNINPRTRIHIGYTAMWWTNVLRPGNQIDPIVDQTRVPIPPGAPVPAFQPLSPSGPHPILPFARSDYWAHGINIGIDFKW
jgi:hypothetical protein